MRHGSQHPPLLGLPRVSLVAVIADRALRRAHAATCARVLHLPRRLHQARPGRLRCCRSVLARQGDRVHHLARSCRSRDRVPGRCLRHALRAGRLVAVDRRPRSTRSATCAALQGALPDPLLRLLRGRPVRHPRGGLRRPISSRCISSTRCCRSSTYPLVTHHQDKEARTGGRTYLTYLLGTSIGFAAAGPDLLPISTGGQHGLLGGGFLAGKRRPAPSALVLLLLFVFGFAKSGLMPFHSWLPGAMVAPTPVCALLHAVAVVKVGVFCIVRVITGVFGVDFLQDLDVAGRSSLGSPPSP